MENETLFEMGKVSELTQGALPTGIESPVDPQPGEQP